MYFSFFHRSNSRRLGPWMERVAASGTESRLVPGLVPRTTTFQECEFAPRRPHFYLSSISIFTSCGQVDRKSFKLYIPPGSLEIAEYSTLLDPSIVNPENTIGSLIGHSLLIPLLAITEPNICGQSFDQPTHTLVNVSLVLKHTYHYLAQLLPGCAVPRSQYPFPSSLRL
ncbi:hypothetical protein VN97_g5425 [Penicillium thymicola]|uniref:Uncharacterized protein n=1 Tax=Penicillium thymicola TaxID=293382 RepID=A0AAI9TIQ5_PENTH|nr:hypothetical protein VN97_g5425 [Penicillium thymicola]